MRIRIVCLLLVLVLALPLVLASCNSATALEDVAAQVYTLYCITGATTTPEAITRVEYEINRTLFYRINSIVKLVMVTADEYRELIDSKMEEIQAYLDSPVEETSAEGSEGNASDVSSATSSSGSSSGKKKTLVNTAKLSDHAKENKHTAMSGDAILEDLEAGIEIELECPRLDLFLVTDYETYLDLAESGDLAPLDTVLSNEAKAIKSYVHSSFFNAAKVGNKTYGVPCNTIIGEYTYIVFNKDVLDASGVAQETLYSLEDLTDYLAIVKEQNPEVVPLANAVTPSAFSYMFEDGFAAYVNESKVVLNTYKDSRVNEYLTMLTRYSSLGYFENNAGKTGEDEDVPFAVKFISGTKEQMEALAKENNYVYNRYSVPIATSENSIDSIFCLSTLCPTSWQTKAMEILTELYTDEDLQNTFLYGIENENYRLEGNQAEGYQVTRINHDYMMDPAHTGNCFIAYTDLDAGDSLTKWTDARDQNVEAVESKTIGFTFEAEEFTFSKLNEEGKLEEYTIAEPDYEEILWNIIQPYYQRLITGTAIDFDYIAAREEADAAARESIRESLLATYEQRLKLRYTANLEQQVKEQYEEQYRAMAEAQVKENIVADFDTNSRRRKLRTQLESENPDASDDEIDALLESTLTNADLLWENYRTIVRTEDQWKDQIEDAFDDLMDERLQAETDRILESAAYLSELNNIPNTAAFQEDYAYGLEVEVIDTVNKNLDAMISELITEYCDQIIAECDEALKTAIDAFTEKYVAAAKETLELTVRKQVEIDYRSENLSEADLDARARDMLNLLENNAANGDDAALEAATKLFVRYYGDMEPEQLKAICDPWKDTYQKVYLPLYSKVYNGENQALYEIGYLGKDALTILGKDTSDDDDAAGEGGDGDDTTSGETSSTEGTNGSEGGTEEPTEPGEEPATPGSYASYYDFVFTVKLQGAYYAQFGEPS